MQACVICGDEIKHNRDSCGAYPVREGRCCKSCDNDFVTPARMELGGKKICSEISRLIKYLQDNPQDHIKLSRGEVLDQLKPGTWLRHKNKLEYMVAGRWEGNWMLVPRRVESGEIIAYPDEEMKKQMEHNWTIIPTEKENRSEL